MKIRNLFVDAYYVDSETYYLVRNSHLNVYHLFRDQDEAISYCRRIQDKRFTPTLPKPIARLDYVLRNNILPDATSLSGSTVYQSGVTTHTETSPHHVDKPPLHTPSRFLP